MPRGHGRITEELIDQITTRIRAGNSIEASCKAVGINDSTLRRWRERGQIEQDRLDAEPDASPRTTEYLYRRAYTAVTQAMADAEAGRVVRILEAGRPHEIVTRVETLRHFKLRDYDDQQRPYDRLETATDVRVETKIDFDWRADAWWLEHARPQYWGRQTPADAATGSEQAITVEADIETRAASLLDELRERREARAQASGE